MNTTILSDSAHRHLSCTVLPGRGQKACARRLLADVSADERNRHQHGAHHPGVIEQHAHAGVGALAPPARRTSHSRLCSRHATYGDGNTGAYGQQGTVAGTGARTVWLYSAGSWARSAAKADRAGVYVHDAVRDKADRWDEALRPAGLAFLGQFPGESVYLHCCRINLFNNHLIHTNFVLQLIPWYHVVNCVISRNQLTA